MEGIRLTLSRSYWILQRTPDTFPSYINDIGAEHDGVRRRTSRASASATAPTATRRASASTAPTGSNDAFYIKIDKHYGSSDHVTYMQHGIPAVMFITWPDMWYHSSEDTPDKQDSDAVQAGRRRRHRRAGGASRPAATRWPAASRPRTSAAAPSGWAIASARRVSYLADARDARGAACRVEGRARRDPASGGRREGRHPIVGRPLSRIPAAAPKRLAPSRRAIDKTAARADRGTARAAYALHAQRAAARRRCSSRRMTAEEKEASNLVVECATARRRSRVARGGRAAAAGGGGRAAAGAAGGGRGAGRARRCRST